VNPKGERQNAVGPSKNKFFDGLQRVERFPISRKKECDRLMMKTLHDITGHAGGLGRRVAVAAAHDEAVLQAVSMATAAHICSAQLFGDAKRIREILRGIGADENDFSVIEPDDSSDTGCAKAAVQAVADGKADFLMKGILSTSDLLRVVVRSDLMAGALLSHVMLYEAPGYGRLLIDTDGGMNPAPDFEHKKKILENAARLLKLLGYETIVAACVSGSETVTEKIPSSVDAKRLSELDWSAYDMTVFGPVGVDLAVSPQACAHKRYAAPGCGRADILLMPNMETGNCFGKALTYFANARSAGLVVGARCPIVLVSRADSAEAKLASLALGAIAAKGGNE